jgi:antitoxin component of RelBE/YafQ-DinJ toxin-antitoxin module
MQTTLRIDDDIYREAKANAARCRLTVTRYIEEALKSYAKAGMEGIESGVEERNRLMEALLKETAHFRIGGKPTREQPSRFVF